MTDETGNKKTKLISITALAIAVLIIIIVANMLMWGRFRDKSLEMAALAVEISQVQQKISGIPEPPKDLNINLAAAQAGLKAAGESFPKAADRNDVVNYMLTLAESCQVQVVPLAVEGWNIEGASAPYLVLRLNGTVAGRLSQVTTFISELQASKYETLTIQELGIARLNVSSDEISGPENNPLVAVRLRIALYASAPVTQKGLV